jgi:methylation protein EvaC
VAQVGSDALVVEIGSNDGTMLHAVHAAGVRCVGIEPAANVAAAARARGLDTVNAFFSRETAVAVRASRGQAQAIVAANVICHVADFHDLASGVCELLAPDGRFVFEEPYLGDMLEKRAYDQIYDEHVFMWSATSVAAAMARHGLELIDVARQPTHGGSMRYYCAWRGRSDVAPAVRALLEQERLRGLGEAATYEQFRLSCEAARLELRSLLIALRDRGKRVAGYAATSKSTTLLNYCGIDSSLVQFIVDSTPLKHGTLTPGSHIPVRAPEAFVTDRPDYAVLLAWNHAAEIFAKELAFTAAGGKWISIVPAVTILD